MKKDYVIVKGKKYNSGDAMPVRWYGSNSGRVYQYEQTATFLDCDEEKDEYKFKIDDREYCFNKICFTKTVKSESNCINAAHGNGIAQRKLTFKDELNIDGMFIAWMWYAFIMLVGVIFNDRIAIWIIASVIFVNYRNKKLRKAGYIL